MSRRHTAACAVFLASLALCGYGLAQSRILAQELWTAFWRPGCFDGLLTRETPLGATAAAFFLAASLCLGARVARGLDAPAAALLGVAVYTALMAATASLPVHMPWVHLAALAPPVICNWRALGQCRLPLAGWPLYLVLLIQLLPALKPEVSADGLAMHLAIPAEVAARTRWHFDVARSAWAVMPMGGDWAYTIVYLLGGEMAARLLNWSFLALAGALVWRAAGSAWLAALFASTPLVMLATGSLFVENLLAAFVLAGFLTPGAAGAALLGAAVNVKLGALAFAAPALIFKRRAALWAVPFALWPYATAWMKTGNPVFPFFNHVFRSPLFDSAAPFLDARYREGLSWTTLYDVTFHSSRFLEGRDGALGVAWLLLVPAALLVARGRALGALALGLGGAAAAFSGQSYLRYVYPALPLAAVGMGPLLAGRGALLAPLIAMNLYLLPASGWYHTELCCVSREAYIERHAPTRRLVETLNREAGAPPAAFLEDPHIAGFRGRAYTATWHTHAFRKSLDEARSPEEQEAAVLGRLGVEWVLARTQPPDRGAHTRHLLLRYGEPAASHGGMSLYRLEASRQWSPEPLAAGAASDASPAIEYVGRWVRDLQFRQAHGGTLTYTDERGAAFRFRFSGTEVDWIFTRAENRGRAEVRIDGVSRGMVSQRGPVEWQRRMTFGGLAPGTHLFEATAAGDGYIDLDAVAVR